MSIFDILKNNKNILGFSGGVDSTALFFILLEKDIQFDIAIVNYNLREEAKFEVEHAKELAKTYNKKIFIKEFSGKFSENIGRDFRYNFFENLIKQYSYNNLLLAHHLNDKCEWFMMQFCKGAGTKELFGMNKIEYRKNYTIIRPLLNKTKNFLINYLKNNNIKYFIDKTNFDTKYKRNYFRLNICDKLIDEYEQGIRKSFLFLENEIKLIRSLYDIKKENNIFIIDFKIDNDNLKISAIDTVLKREFCIVLTYKTKLEIVKQKDIIISHKIVVSFYKNFVFISKILKKVKFDKGFKEFCRINKIPKNFRNILYNNKNNLKKYLI